MRGTAVVLVLCTVAAPVLGQGTVEVFVTKSRQAETAGDLPLAVVHLQSARRISPDDPHLTNALAVLHTRLGKQCYQDQDLDGALSHFGAADRLTPDVEGILQSLGIIHATKGDPVQARRCMERVLKLNPKNTSALTVLGNLARERNDTGTASKLYHRAANEEPGRRDLRLLADRLGKQARIEEGFTTELRGSFCVQYLGGKEAGIERNIDLVFGYLEQAEDELHKQLGQRPNRIITAVVYSDEQYKGVGVHAWARAHYDGKIRIAVRPNTGLQQSMRADLRHELTHAFLFELFPQAPLWVHEGYAQLIDGHSVLVAKSRLRGSQPLLSKELFLGSFNESRELAVVETGYAQSLMAVGYLQRSGTRRQFRSFLRLVGGGVPSDDALQRVYGFDVTTMLAKALGR